MQPCALFSRPKLSALYHAFPSIIDSLSSPPSNPPLSSCLTCVCAGILHANKRNPGGFLGAALGSEDRCVAPFDCLNENYSVWRLLR